MSSVTPPTPRKRSPRGQGAHLRTELLDATLHQLATEGDPEDVSIRAVAKAVGVSPTAVYQHFADRDALLEAACDRAFEVFSRHLIGETGHVVDPFEALALLGQAYLRFALSEPGLYRVLFSNPLHQVHQAKGPDVLDASTAGGAAFGVLVERVQACLDAGAPAPTADGSPPDAVYLSFQVWSWLHGIVDLRITHSTMPWPEAEPMVHDIGRVLGLVPPA